MKALDKGKLVWLGGIFLFLALGAVSIWGQFLSPSPVPETQEETGPTPQEELWESKKPENYTIEVLQAGPWTHLQVRISISRGEVSECWTVTDTLEECSENIVPENFTPEGLFQVLRNGRNRFSVFGPSLQKVEFHPEYGFPSHIELDNPSVFDDEMTFEVLNFIPK